MKMDVWPFDHTLLVLKSDYSQPSEEIKEIYGWVKKVMMSNS